MAKFTNLRGTSNADDINGLEEVHYRVKARAGRDSVQTSDGDDRVWAGAGSDVVVARGGANRVWGGGGNDEIYTGSGRDVVRGGKGNDLISTGEGLDKAYGGAGADTFVTVDGGQGRVKIMDFEVDDVITFCGCGSTRKEQNGRDTWIIKGSDVKAVIKGVSVDEISIDYDSKIIAMIGSEVLA